MKSGCFLLVAALLVSARAEEPFPVTTVYNISVELNCGRAGGPGGEVCPFTRYSSTGRFERVGFGPSPSPELAAWFEPLVMVESAEPGRPGEWRRIPTRRLVGAGEIDGFELAPGYLADGTPVEPDITAGPNPFRPTLQLIAPALATDIAASRWYGVEDEAPPWPEEPKLWFLYDEDFTLHEPELVWVYPGLADGAVEARALTFSLPLSGLVEGSAFELRLPLADSSARGEWTVRFEVREPGR